MHFFWQRVLVAGSCCILDRERGCCILTDFEVVVAFLVDNVVDEQSNMGTHFVSQCFVVICVGLLLVIALRILAVAFSCLHVQNLES